MVWGRGQVLSRGRLKVPAYFAKTEDSGATWSTPKPIAANAINHLSYGNNLVVDPDDGTLFNFYGFRDLDTGVSEIRYVKSTNGGDTWSRPRFVNRLRPAGVAHPVTGESVRTSEFFPDVTINGINGDIFLVWQDSRNTGGRRDEILFSSSEDGGVTWSRVFKISSRVKRPAFIPTVAMNAVGTLGVSYFDFRNMTPGDADNLTTDYWLRTSTDNGRTWTRDFHVAEDFNLRAAPKVNGQFSLGDYAGLTAAGSDFIPFFVRTQCSTGGCRGNRTDVLSSTITP
jgi:Neuraminidase (sialidase)